MLAAAHAVHFCGDVARLLTCQINIYETLMKVMDTLHQAGYLKIGLVGEETAKAK